MIGATERVQANSRTARELISSHGEPAAGINGKRSKPLLPLRGVVSLVDLSEDQVLGLIESGALPWAWDVALDPSMARSRELRVLPACVASYIFGKPCMLDWEAVLALLVPNRSGELVSTEVTRILNISGLHLYNLVDREQIIPCSGWRRGPGGGVRFKAKSFINFLKQRRAM